MLFDGAACGGAFFDLQPRNEARSSIATDTVPTNLLLRQALENRTSGPMTVPRVMPFW